MPQARTFFTAEQQQEIIRAIRNAEMDTSGEIRLHLEESCGDDVLDRAADIFRKLEMHKTELRNGVLIYLAVKDRQFAIIGDVGINEKVPENFWDDIKEDMVANFIQGNFVKGLINAIEASGKELKNYFPRNAGDINEMSDEISFRND
jgi:uncharacterized membrane protein